MPSCERCWANSRVHDNYREVLEQNEGLCTPEEQAGPEATECEYCNRRTRHQHCGICMNCGADREEPQP